MFNDGVLVIDKPAGPTSHDVVAVMRRIIRSTMADGRSTIKVGHTGTLDPLASGVLPLVLGKATRLAQFLSSAEKEYEAHVELGVTTTTLDRGGEVVSRDRASDLARRNAPVALDPLQVTALALELLEFRGTTLRLRLVCSAGYYVRSLADALGERLGTGAHLAGLVRTRSGEFTIADAVGLEVLDRRPAEAAARVIPLAALLPSLPAITLTPEGASLAARGGFIGPGHTSGGDSLPTKGRVRLFHPDGHLVALAEPRSEGHAGPLRHFLHPNVVLE